MELYIIHYTDSTGRRSLVDVTNNFDKWLEQNNNERDECEAETADTFEITTTEAYIFDDDRN